MAPMGRIERRPERPLVEAGQLLEKKEDTHGSVDFRKNIISARNVRSFLLKTIAPLKVAIRVSMPLLRCN